MKARKYKHLSFEDRCVIKEFLNNKYNFTKIVNRLRKDRTTIADEVRKHRFLRTTFIPAKPVVFCLTLLVKHNVK